MLPTPTRASRRHQVVLSLTPQGLRVLHLRRGLLGWRSAHEERLPIPPHQDEHSAIAPALVERFQQWAVPKDSHAYWVVTGDILGVVTPAPGSTAAALPFPAGEIRTHTDGFGSAVHGAAPAPLFWIHKDWVAELERITSHCGLQLIEIFARGQLFQQALGTSQRTLRALVERDGEECFLHIYATSGKLLRTRMLDGGTLADGQVLQSLLKIEALAFGTAGHVPDLEVVDTCGLLKEPWEGAILSTLPATSPQAGLVALWRSSIEGIAIRSVHQGLVRDLMLGSAALGAAGLLIVGGFAWHDGRLQEEITSTAARIKRQQPRVDSALAQRTQTLRMADAVQASDGTQKNVDAFDTFQRGLAVFPPAPATLQYLRATPDTLELAATGGEAAIQWMEKNPPLDFTPFSDFTPPDDVIQQKPDIHLQTRRNPAPQASPAEPQASKP